MSDITASMKAEESKKATKKKDDVDPSFNMHELRELAPELDGWLRHFGCAERRRLQPGHARLHVLGVGM